MKYDLEEFRKKIKAKIDHDIKGIINELEKEKDNGI